ncbi:alpha/beta hydrolase [Altererythrobacter sp. FM1]|uniref:alpha/beta fold hydrolase n=1 Tax=Tsuneonella flava TaxID=2055955 RepID=UPI000C805B66|nr:alpha/beta hydrolase [Tsuneonella flava]ROT93738.1 alpha/beta hydrolase [Altererythrobacter sp. FM1]UBS33148.1 alpha/beta hydrolase [Altererythrobacter sp. N1]
MHNTASFTGAPDAGGKSAERAWADRTWQTADGLELHYRDYPGRDDRPPVICLHGLTRNARDFAALAERIAGEWRVIVPEMRGRGESDYAKDSATYTPLHYVADVMALLAEQGIERFVSVGTSLGGLMTMLIAATTPDRIAAVLLNDVGPQLEAAGLERIVDYVGQGRSFPTWMHAARALEAQHRESHPGFTIDDWLAMAKRVMVLGSGGRIAFDYDMAIAAPFEDADPSAAPDMWPMFETLAGRPLALVRGECSNVLSAATAQEMKRRIPAMDLVTVPNVGHTPLLTEPEAVAALDRLLAQVA